MSEKREKNNMKKISTFKSYDNFNFEFNLFNLKHIPSNTKMMMHSSVFVIVRFNGPQTRDVYICLHWSMMHEHETNFA